jgi:hypothetical protein
MRRLLPILGVLCCLTSTANAGPNAGGVLVDHDRGAVCESCVPQPLPSDCHDVDNQAPMGTAERIWAVYAVFPQTSNPRLKIVAWGTQFPESTGSPYSYVSIVPAGCSVPDEDGAGTDFYLAYEGFPTASGGEIRQSFPTGPRLNKVVRLFNFAGFGYAAGAQYPAWCTAPNSDPAHRAFEDDAVPPNADPIMGYGCLGFGTPGYTPCPIDPVPAERTSWGRIKNSHR